jgi:hypothetical protein
MAVQYSFKHLHSHAPYRVRSPRFFSFAWYLIVFPDLVLGDRETSIGTLELPFALLVDYYESVELLLTYFVAVIIPNVWIQTLHIWCRGRIIHGTIYYS